MINSIWFLALICSILPFLDSIYYVNEMYDKTIRNSKRMQYWVKILTISNSPLQFSLGINLNHFNLFNFAVSYVTLEYIWKRNCPVLLSWHCVSYKQQKKILFSQRWLWLFLLVCKTRVNGLIDIEWVTNQGSSNEWALNWRFLPYFWFLE